jgi:hypothetical protein
VSAENHRWLHRTGGHADGAATIQQAEWAEIDVEKGDLVDSDRKNEDAVTASRPLSRQVLAMIEELREITGHRQHLFPCMEVRGGPRPRTPSIRRSVGLDMTPGK